VRTSNCRSRMDSRSGYLDLAPGAGDAAAKQRGEDTLDEMRASHHVGHSKAERDGRLRSIPIEIGQAGE